MLTEISSVSELIVEDFSDASHGLFENGDRSIVRGGLSEGNFVLSDNGLGVSGRFSLDFFFTGGGSDVVDLVVKFFDFLLLSFNFSN